MRGRLEIKPKAENARRLTLIRHAKAWPQDGSYEDFERPLAERGLLDAGKLADALAKAGFKTELILSSAAKRALQTAEIFASALGLEELASDVGLYDAGTLDLLDAVKALPDSLSSAILVGHNPSIGELAARLQPSLDPDVPTCAVICLDFAAETWAELDGTAAETVFVLTPKTL